MWTAVGDLSREWVASRVGEPRLGGITCYIYPTDLMHLYCDATLSRPSL